jgi:DNA mismatch endonuclease (patch repair protein)
MSRIRGKDTTPERVVRSLLHRLGHRFRLHHKIPIPQLPVHRLVHRSFSEVGSLGVGGSALNPLARRSAAKTAQLKQRFVTPDIVLIKQRVAIFVHGCFWHRHRGCKNCTTPTHRREWSLKKLEGNAARDKLHKRALRKLGWRPIVIWECQIEKPKTLDRLSRKLAKLIG